MPPSYEIPVEALLKQCDPAQFDFHDTSELDPLETVIGQERAVQAIDFGLNMKSAGYNIFVTGPVGTGKTTIVGDFGKQFQRYLSAGGHCRAARMRARIFQTDEQIGDRHASGASQSIRQ